MKDEMFLCSFEQRLKYNEFVKNYAEEFVKTEDQKLLPETLTIIFGIIQELQMIIEMGNIHYAKLTRDKNEKND